MAGLSAFAFSSAAHAQESSEVVVTGSRVVTNGNRAPTPITTVATETLLQATPSNIPDALKTLPQFGISSGQRNASLAGGNNSANTLSLRNFGAQRTLILLDGARVPGSDRDGVVNVDTLPEMLIERVDIVTGGASAVYGSDAVAGVVNYLVDNDFNGIKTESQVGISKYGDNESWKVGVAGGMDLGERAHIEGSYIHYDSAGIGSIYDRPYGDLAYTVTGNGTAANPFVLVPNGRYQIVTRGGIIKVGPPSLLNWTFKEGGAAGPFVNGVRTGSAGFESGGDGGWLNVGPVTAPLRTDGVFTRFDYDINDNIQAFAQASYNSSYTRYPIIGNLVLQANGQILSGNPFLPANVQALMTAAGAQSISVARIDHKEDGYKTEDTRATVHSFFATAGLKGSIFDDFDWTLQYSRGRSTNRVDNIGNLKAEKISAALDAVINPATGTVVCRVSLTAFAWRFPGCTPLNIMGYTGPSQAAWDFARETTFFTLINSTHDVTFSIAGSPFSTWAGPVQTSLSGEYRHLSLTNHSSVEPTSVMDCTGLRNNCGPNIPVYNQAITASMDASQNVKEGAIEVLVPLADGLPLLHHLEVNAAGRYTEYSTSGPVSTWKLGASWEITDELRLRGTKSRDIRAPSLRELFSPTTVSPAILFDLHTQLNGAPYSISQGNAGLVPEVASTHTAGIVYQPRWLPNFSVALDYYSIEMTNAITNVNGANNAVQAQCQASNGSSPYCALLVRPLPFSDRTPANYPTAILNQGVNAAKQWTQGWDLEANYRFDLADVFENAPGSLTMRGLLAYQPVYSTQTVLNGPIDHQAGVGGLSKFRGNVNLTYDVGDLTVNVQERWQTGNQPYDRTQFVYTVPDWGTYSYTNLTVSYRLRFGDNELRPFFAVQNIFDKSAPITGSQPGNPGLFYGAAPGYDVIGRYFTVGLRTRF